MDTTHEVEHDPDRKARSQAASPAPASGPTIATPAAIPVAGLAAGDRVVRRHGGHTADPLGGTPVPATTMQALRRRRSAGSPLPEDLAARMGSAFEADLSDVRVHTDPEADRIARSVASDAFTYGTDLYFTSGRFDPHSEPGQRLLAHELTHVVQPDTGSSSGPTIGRADDPAEREADRTADKVVTALRRHAAEIDHDHEHAGDQDHDAMGNVDGHAHHGTLRRHGSPEHLILGQMGPRDLRKIPDAKALLPKFGFKADLQQAAGGNKVPLSQIVAARTEIREAIHLVLQERARVRQWQDGPSKGRAPNAPDQIFDVEIMTLDNDTTNGLPNPTPPVLVTYGEMNTLADYFGSVDDLQAVSNDTMYKVLQTEREDYYTYLGSLFRELTANDYVVRTHVIRDSEGEHTEDVTYYRSEKWYENNLNQIFSDKEGYDVPAGVFGSDTGKEIAANFEGTQSSLKTAGVASWIAGMHGIDTVLDKDPATKEQGSGGVWGATARNACHFAPQSWYSWKKYHEKARDLAKSAYELHAKGDDEKAAALANQAYVNNGFGDHYLQDSFAAGHLINKTLVMQWYLSFINDNWSFFGPSETEWSRLMMMTERKQPGLAGRQLYDKDVTASGTSPQDIDPRYSRREEAFAGTGLIAPSFSPGVEALLKWWRKEIGTNAKRKTVARSELLKAPGASKAAVDELLELPYVVDKGRTWGSYVPLSGGEDRYYMLNETPGVSHDKAKRGEDYNVGKTMTYNLYAEFMKNALIQSGAGDLHNYFCKNGLDVMNDDGDSVFRIYGDYVMLTAGGGQGVQISAETAEMSRNSIKQILETGKTDVTLQDIFDRFPSYVAMPDRIFDEAVKPADEPDYDKDGKQMLRLDKWHDELHPVLTKIFTKGSGTMKERMTWFGARLPTKTDLAELDVVVPHGGKEF